MFILAHLFVLFGAIELPFPHISYPDWSCDEVIVLSSCGHFLHSDEAIYLERLGHVASVIYDRIHLQTMELYRQYPRHKLRIATLQRWILCFSVVSGCLAFGLFSLAWENVAEDLTMTTLLREDASLSISRKQTLLESKVTLPIINVGWPKSGSTSLYHFFQCNHLHAQHFCCCGETKDHPPCRDMATCILRNLGLNASLLEGCGDYDVYMQLDGERPTRTFGKARGVLLENARYHIIAHGDRSDLQMHLLPQIFFLEELHEASPNATYILPLRPPEEWANSVFHWFNARGRIVNEFRHFNQSLQRPGKALAKQFLARVYQEHNDRIRLFVKKYSSHKLVEVNITEPNAGEQLSATFGLNASCWGHHNKLGTRAKPFLQI